MRALSDPAQLRERFPGLDHELLARYLRTFEGICAGDPAAGPVALEPPSERFHWLTSPRSDVLQTSPIHEGLCDDPARALDALFESYVTADQPPAIGRPSPAIVRPQSLSEIRAQRRREQRQPEGHRLVGGRADDAGPAAPDAQRSKRRAEVGIGVGVRDPPPDGQARDRGRLRQEVRAKLSQDRAPEHRPPRHRLAPSNPAARAHRRARPTAPAPRSTAASWPRTAATSRAREPGSAPRSADPVANSPSASKRGRSARRSSDRRCRSTSRVHRPRRTTAGFTHAATARRSARSASSDARPSAASAAARRSPSAISPTSRANASLPPAPARATSSPRRRSPRRSRWRNRLPRRSSRTS